MRLKKTLFMMLIAVACFFGITSVNAATISDDGKYSLVLVTNDENSSIDGEYAKIFRFNVSEGETTVKLSELTKGIVPFNGKTEFLYWEMAENAKASEELAIADFTGSGDFYLSTGEKVVYTNGLTLSAKFSDKELKDSGNYYVSFDAFGGVINDKAKLLLVSKKEEFATIDLTKYTPVRKGYTFKGWDLNGKIVTSIISSSFANDSVVNLTATYIKDDFAGDDRVLILNANGGTISGSASKKYDYLGGGNSGTAMSLIPYIPVREGYTFNGWNSKKDGSGKNYTYIYWRLWDNDGKTDVEKDTIIKNELGAEYYQNVTLYASWAKNSGTEIKSNGGIKSSIIFEDEINNNYTLDIKKVEVKKELADKNVKYVFDINVLENGNVVKISDTKMRIKIALPEDLKGYKKYEVVYISDDKIEETISAVVEDGYIVFETSHLSEYGIVATEKLSNTIVENPKTGDNISSYLIVSILSMVGVARAAITIYRKKQTN